MVGNLEEGADASSLPQGRAWSCVCWWSRGAVVPGAIGARQDVWNFLLRAGLRAHAVICLTGIPSQVDECASTPVNCTVQRSFYHERSGKPRIRFGRINQKRGGSESCSARRPNDANGAQAFSVALSTTRTVSLQTHGPERLVSTSSTMTGPFISRVGLIGYPYFRSLCQALEAAAEP